MANKTAILSVSLVSDAKKYGKGFKQAESSLDKFEKKAKKLAVPATAVAAGLAVIGKKTFDLASEAEQNFGAIDAVFKDHAAGVHKMARTTARDIGVSGSDYEKYAALIGSQLKNLGVPMDQLAGKTDSLVKMGADFAAQFGGTNVEAIEAISSALKGEMDPIEKYGISLNQAAIKAKMAEMGMGKLTGKAESQGKAMAIMALLNEQGADAMGANAREAGTAAGALSRLSAVGADLGAKLGTALLPAAVAIAGILMQVADWASQNTEVVTALAVGLAAAAAAVFVLLGALKVYRATLVAVSAAQAVFGAGKGIVTGVQNLVSGFNSGAAAASSFTGRLGTIGGAAKTAVLWIGNSTKALVVNTGALLRNAAVATAMAVKTAAIAVATGVATAAQWAWNVAMSANPIALVIIAIAALVAGIIWFVTQTAAGRAAWAAFTGFMVAAVQNSVALVRNTWTLITLAFRIQVNAIRAAWSAFTGFLASMAAGAVARVVAVVNLIRNRFAAIVAAVKAIWSAGWGYLAGRASSVIGSIVGRFNAIVGAVRNAVGWVRRLFSFRPPSWLGAAAGAIGNLFGAAYMKPAFDVPEDGRPFFLTAATAPLVPPSRTATRTAPMQQVTNNYRIDMSGLIGDKLALARELRKLLDGLARSEGRKVGTIG